MPNAPLDVSRNDRPTSQPEPKVRVQVDLAEGLVHELDELMRDCRIETRRELINNALSVLQWAVQETMQGHPVASFNAEEKYYNVLRMPALDAAAAVGRRRREQARPR